MDARNVEMGGEGGGGCKNIGVEFFVKNVPKNL